MYVFVCLVTRRRSHVWFPDNLPRQLLVLLLHRQVELKFVLCLLK